MIFLENPSFDNSIIGLSTDDRIIYDYNKMLDELMDKYDMNLEDAISFIDFNTIRALDYMGKNKPIIMYEDDENLEYELEQRNNN